MIKFALTIDAANKLDMLDVLKEKGSLLIGTDEWNGHVQ